MKGWVYVITNPGMPELVKVGYSERDPENRAKELNGTASPHPHVVEFAALVDYPKKVESELHTCLSEYNEGKEWFRCHPDLVKSYLLHLFPNILVTHGKANSTISIDSFVCLTCGNSFLSDSSTFEYDQPVCRQCT